MMAFFFMITPRMEMIKILGLMMGQFLWVMCVVVTASGCIQDWIVVVVVKVTDDDSYCYLYYYTQNCIVLAIFANCKLVVVANLFLYMIHTRFIIVTFIVKIGPLHVMYLVVCLIAL